jgi:hypothetical protein
MKSEERNDLRLLACQDGVTDAQPVFGLLIAWEGSAKLSAAI